ncbi:MAG: FapA family protein [Desulfuromonadaceae bacterium]|nr:FapA family protein [Desulfuromonadaceae bacterium]MDD5105264.1 FapA family protein [Desulfuromonadaceae bacterium]
MTEQLQPAPPETPAIGGSEIRKPGYSLYLRIPDNALECRCSYVPRGQGSMMTRDEFAGYLSQYIVKVGIDQHALDDFATKAVAGQQLVDVLVASGIAPLNGADECIRLSVQSSTAVLSGDEEITEVDMHIVQSFINVSIDDEVGRIIPAEQGTPGQNIMGQPIPALPGKPLSVKIGKNIRVEEGGVLIAATTGRLCQTPGEISIEDEYLVKGDVNFRIGSINFKGVVEVRGDVLDNFDITASKGLTVTGNIGVCNIVSDGDITFCGMDGMDKAKIVCGGTLRAHFIHDVDVECAGDVLVDVEIHNCTIKTLGKVVVDKGALSGGSCTALGGIEAKKLGTASSIHTNLRAGIDYHDVALLDDLLTALTKANAQAGETQSPSELAELRKTTGALTDSITSIRSKIDERANAKINAKAVMYENVQLTLGSTTELIYEQKDGPHSAIENSIDGGLRFLSMTSLNVKAADIEQAFVQEYKMSQRKV